jgi:hypothetical protein
MSGPEAAAWQAAPVQRQGAITQIKSPSCDFNVLIALNSVLKIRNYEMKKVYVYIPQQPSRVEAN